MSALGQKQTLAPVHFMSALQKRTFAASLRRWRSASVVVSDTRCRRSAWDGMATWRTSAAGAINTFRFPVVLGAVSRRAPYQAEQSNRHVELPDHAQTPSDRRRGDWKCSRMV